jgi:TP901 family phage tail tape measure protein
MVLAKAGELDVADASSLVANTLNTFHLKASRAGDIANYLANAANISSADVSDLAESLKYVAPVAAATGRQPQADQRDPGRALQQGIAASNAGTGFRKFLLSLQAPSGAAQGPQGRSASRSSTPAAR